MQAMTIYDAALESARATHADQGGYLLRIGDRPNAYIVCDHDEAIEMGRTPEHLESLAPSYSEA